MPGTPRKPAGPAGAYIVAASWLHRETQYAQKLLLVKDWESVKPIITQYPQPPTLGSLVYAVDADTADRAVEVANEKGWGTKLHGTEFTTREVAIVDSSIINAYNETIVARREEYLAEHAPAARAAKRARPTKHDAAAGSVVLNLFNQMETQPKPATEMSTEAPVDTPHVQPPGWGDDDEPAAPEIDPVNDTKPAAVPDSMTNSQLQAELTQLQSQLKQMKNEVVILQNHVVDLDRAVFDTKSIIIHNIKMSANETGPMLLDLVKQIFADLKLPINDIQKAVRLEGSKDTGRRTFPVVVVTFTSEFAADVMYTNAKYFHPAAWTEIAGGAAKVKLMTQMRNPVVGYCNSNGRSIRHDGYMAVMRFIKGKTRHDKTRSGRHSPPPAHPKPW